jgi:feruloyl esterase
MGQQLNNKETGLTGKTPTGQGNSFSKLRISFKTKGDAMNRIAGRLAWIASAAAAATGLVACGGNDDSPPRLSAAVPAPLATSCANLPARLGGLADTTITAVTDIPAGSLTVASQPIGEHCLVQGKMASRVSALDGNNYAIGFEMRLPVNWNGRFFHQGNGGIDGSVVPA